MDPLANLLEADRATRSTFLWANISCVRVHSELKSRPNLTKVIQRQILETSLRFPLPNSSQLQVHSLFQMANTSAVVHEPFTFRELHENGEIPLSVRKEQWQGNYKEAAIFLEVSINSIPSFGYRCFYLAPYIKGYLWLPKLLNSRTRQSLFNLVPLTA